MLGFQLVFLLEHYPTMQHSMGMLAGQRILRLDLEVHRIAVDIHPSVSSHN